MTLRLVSRTLVVVSLTIIALLTIIPFMLVLFLSVRDHLDIVIDFWSFPSRLKWENYYHAFEAVKNSIWNSLYVCAITVVGSLFLASLSGYVFARHRFRGKTVLFFLLIGVMMIPSVLTIVPLYSIIVNFHLTGSYWALILPYISGSQILGIMLCRTFFESLPEDLFEAAKMDGAGEWFLYARIALPLSISILVTIGITTFLAVYNDYIWPLIVLKESQYTFTVAAVNLTSNGQPDLGLRSAAYVIGSVPTLIVLMVGMKYYVEGIVSGAVKS